METNQIYQLNKVTSIDLDEEYLNELNKVISEAREINDLNLQINSMIIEQGEKINVSNKDCNISLTNIEKSNVELEKASEYQMSAFYKKGLLLALCVSVVSLPVAFIVGTKIAIGAGIGSALVVGNIV
jgi:t-SNARE complex subunit (syntaxin)